MQATIQHDCLFLILQQDATASYFGPSTQRGDFENVFEVFHMKTEARTIMRLQQTITEQFVNLTMRDGKKAQAERNLFTAFQLLSKHGSPLDLFTKAIESISPICKVQSQRRGAKIVHYPKPLTTRQRYRLGMLWLKDETLKPDGSSFGQRLYSQIMKIHSNTSPITQKRDQLHKMAISNRSNIMLKPRR